MKRKLLNYLFRTVAACCLLAAGGTFLVIFYAIASRGWAALDWSFFSEQIALGGASGGILYQLLGTLILITTAVVVCAPFAVGIALVHGVYLRDHPIKKQLTLLLYLMNGVPSILFGILGMMVFVQWLDWGKSWLAGGILLAVMMLPTVAVTLIERISSLPERYLDAARGLGLRRSQMIRAVVLPQSIGGLITGLLLGVARAAGETAPIMFTATIFAGASLPSGVRESPVLSLPYHIFILAQDSHDPAVRTKLWGAALVLLFIVMAFSLAALPIRLKLHEESDHV